MIDKIKKENSFSGETLPFPVDWVKTQPRKVEDILSGLSVEEQVRYILGLDLISNRIFSYFPKKRLR